MLNSLYRYSCQHYHLDYLLINLFKKKSKIYPTFCYPIFAKIIIIIYNINMDKVSVYYLDPLNFRCCYHFN